ncbi:hypothetical protein EVAR_43978_1 [Eumeta japonica]|uniref:Uncharacterized protein n=1 Tax=Eumeta variegata TaxID=151549 RepID=A0A4C1XDK0_EUMVA|nr:hypothetical protein EVAR_43978_1 [Eumeta japonica]
MSLFLIIAISPQRGFKLQFVCDNGDVPSNGGTLNFTVKGPWKESRSARARLKTRIPSVTVTRRAQKKKVAKCAFRSLIAIIESISLRRYSPRQPPAGRARTARGALRPDSSTAISSP